MNNLRIEDGINNENVVAAREYLDDRNKYWMKKFRNHDRLLADIEKRAKLVYHGLDGESLSAYINTERERAFRDQSEDSYYRMVLLDALQIVWDPLHTQIIAEKAAAAAQDSDSDAASQLSDANAGAVPEAMVGAEQNPILIDASDDSSQGSEPNAGAIWDDIVDAEPVMMDVDAAGEPIEPAAWAPRLTPKRAVHEMYGQLVPQVHITRHDYVTWCVGSENDNYWTGCFICPRTRELFLTHNYRGSQGQGQIVGGFVCYTNKKSAEHGAAATAYDCRTYRQLLADDPNAQPSTVHLVDVEFVYRVDRQLTTLPNGAPIEIQAEVARLQQAGR